MNVITIAITVVALVLFDPQGLVAGGHRTANRPTGAAGGGGHRRQLRRVGRPPVRRHVAHPEPRRHGNGGDRPSDRVRARPAARRAVRVESPVAWPVGARLLAALAGPGRGRVPPRARGRVAPARDPGPGKGRAPRRRRNAAARVGRRPLGGDHTDRARGHLLRRDPRPVARPRLSTGRRARRAPGLHARRLHARLSRGRALPPAHRRERRRGAGGSSATSTTARSSGS